MKKRNNKADLSTSIAIASLLISVISLVWIGGFRMSTLIHEVGDLKDALQKVETKLDLIDTDLHKTDVRVTTLEQHNH